MPLKRQSQPEGFHQAVHAVGGEHPRAGTAGRAGVVFQQLQTGGIDLAGLERAIRLKDEDQIDGLAIGPAPAAWPHRK